MTKLGGTILGLIVLAAIAFASMLSFGPAALRPAPPAARPDEVLAPLSIAKAEGAPLAIPVAGFPADALADTWGDSRDEGARVHQAIDIPAPGGTPVVAAAPGRIEKLFNSAAGGVTLYVRSPDRAWNYYYAHLANYAPGIREGMMVRQGTLLGFVGDTGNAGPGNTHLHFAVNRMRPGDSWSQGEPRNPFPLLAGQALRR
ncbi:M23 family metallopeptidase [Sphingomonas radiodurans]|uniref:M23 family metallopeptidase n=1 Tax=Sphingomonas radiodurans TaxID=2890321 RepID=UPI001E5617CB|nr:M23 family metallopeptidase [Sphingomonas radiodurans]WBH16532.1 M23 family metallopeptidase [Sphingomonas radiodurans]